MTIANTLFPLLKLVPKNIMSRCVGRLAYTNKIPSFFHRSFIRKFAKIYKIKLEDTKIDSFQDFKTFGSFFIRELNDGARTIESGIVSPCDSVLSQGGSIKNGRLCQIKGLDYKLSDLLPDRALSDSFLQGSYATLYLSPKHYHRVHSPTDGKIIQTFYVPGNLWPVNTTSVRKVPGLFCRNERLSTIIQAPKYGKIAVIFVGATIVGHIHLKYCNEVSSNQNGNRHLTNKIHNPGIPIKKGDELGYFTLGSTIILLVEKSYPLVKDLELDLKYGSTLFQPIG